MPEPVPSTDVKPKGKKISPVVYVGGAVLLVAALYYYKKKRESEAGSTSESTPYTSQSFIPVTGENVAGVGAGAYGGSGSLSGEGNNNTALIEALNNNNKATLEFLTESRKSNAEESVANRQFQEGLIKSITAQTGGGAPSSGQSTSGAGSGGGGSGATTTKAPAAPPATYKDITCGNGCPGHKYTTHTDCAVKKGGKCVWP